MQEWGVADRRGVVWDAPAGLRAPRQDARRGKKHTLPPVVAGRQQPKPTPGRRETRRCSG